MASGAVPVQLPSPFDLALRSALAILGGLRWLGPADSVIREAIIKCPKSGTSEPARAWPVEFLR
jgi:hypothetical protein